MSAHVRKLLAALLVAVVLVTTQVTPAAAAFTDTQGHWARSAIEGLVAKEIIGGYPDNTFKPEQPITRAEFAKMAATAFAITPNKGQVFSDTAGHWASGAIHSLAADGYVEGYPDGSFRPDQPITRAESVMMVARLLGVADVEGFAKANATTFSDIPVNHWAYQGVEATSHLGLLPAFIQDSFAADVSLTRAEAAWILYQSMRLSRESGRITFVDAPTNRVTVQTSNDRIRDFRAEPATIIVRNESTQALRDLAVGDNVFVVADRFGTPRLIVSDSQSVVDRDLTKQVAKTILEVFTAEELQQMVAGNWSVAADGAKREVEERLIASGVTELEAAAILNQDWSTLVGSAQDRLEAGISERLQISPELATALLQQDWNTAKEKAQLEVAQHLLNRLLSTMDSSA